MVKAAEDDERGIGRRTLYRTLGTGIEFEFWLNLPYTEVKCFNSLL